MIDIGLIGDLYIFVLAGFLGYQLISRVSPLLHTPLMSATNAISGISLVGSLVVAGAGYGKVSTALGFIAVTASTINVVGGFLITDRILKMFRAGGAGEGRSPKGAASGGGAGEGRNAKGAASGGK
jgi:NAD(P) transhydrogenase subunit alpha